jgi:hypothetical protein
MLTGCAGCGVRRALLRRVDEVEQVERVASEWKALNPGTAQYLTGLWRPWCAAPRDSSFCPAVAVYV